MAIDTLDKLIAASANAYQAIPIAKASITNAAAGQIHSLWRATGQPAQAAIPAAAATPDRTTLGALGQTNPGGSNVAYIALATLQNNNSGGGIFIYDRVGHMGGLSGTLLTAQTVNVSVAALAAARRGLANLSEIEWFLEWYTDTGATASNATINVTYGDDTSENLPVIAVGGTVRASRMIQILPGTAGKYIKIVNTVTLSASTGTAGSFGVTAVRRLAECPLGFANTPNALDWAQIGMPVIPNDACLAFGLRCANATTGTLAGMVRLVEG